MQWEMDPGSSPGVTELNRYPSVIPGSIPLSSRTCFFVIPDLIRDPCWITRTAWLTNKPGLAPAGEALFFASPKKSTQKKGDPQSATPALRYGANLRRCGCGVRRGTRFAAAQRRSDSHGESDHEARALRRACHPATAPPQAQPAGVGQPNIQTSTRAFASLGRVCAARGACAREMGPSAAMARMDVRRVPFWMRLGRAGRGVACASERACFVN